MRRIALLIISLAIIAAPAAAQDGLDCSPLRTRQTYGALLEETVTWDEMAAVADNLRLHAVLCSGDGLSGQGGRVFGPVDMRAGFYEVIYLATLPARGGSFFAIDAEGMDDVFVNGIISHGGGSGGYEGDALFEVTEDARVIWEIEADSGIEWILWMFYLGE